jgi:hypothetical protein
MPQKNIGAWESPPGLPTLLAHCPEESELLTDPNVRSKVRQPAIPQVWSIRTDKPTGISKQRATINLIAI